MCWFTASQFRQNGPQEFAGSIRFEGPAPPVAFIQLLRLNSPREEDFVTEIREGQFAFRNVPPGDYALWLAAADGKPIPCRPVGSSIGLLTEAEHHLRITLAHSSGPFAFEFVTVLEHQR